MLSKGFNGVIGTILGGLLGCSVSALTDQIGGIGEAVAVGTFVFVFGVAASYTRLIPAFGKRHDYGLVVFMLTFNLIILSGMRDEKTINVARDHILAICMGFAVCMIISFAVFPIWASDEVKSSIVSRFNGTASSIEDYDKDNHMTTNAEDYGLVLYSKSKDETLAYCAKWEPWHGKLGFCHPWDTYLKIGEQLRELAAFNLVVKGCLKSPRQPSPRSLKEPCEAMASLLVGTQRELGESIDKMKVSRQATSILKKLQKTRLELSASVSPSKLENDDGIAGVSFFLFLLMEMADKVEMLAKEVEQLGALAGWEVQAMLSP